MIWNSSQKPSDSFTVAFFSMEFGIDPAISTYSGGLGILAGDNVRAAADLGLPMAGVTLLHRKGYFRQHLDSCGNQSEIEATWSPEALLERLPVRVLVPIAGRQVQVQAWRYLVRGQFGDTVPIYFLDTDLLENSPWDRSLSGHLYGGDASYRLCQEIVLGLGGVAMLRALGYRKVQAYHMNEGHSALAVIALLEEQCWGRGLSAATNEDREAVRQHCVFTTHTPLRAGHDEFPLSLVLEMLGEERTNFLMGTQCCPNGSLNMTNLALDFSRYINGVSMRHEKVSRTVFSNYPIDAVTNGVHATTWTSPPFQRLYDRYIPGWRRDNQYLRYSVSIPLEDIWQAHIEAKQEMIQEVERRTGARLDPKVMTFGFARRAAPYKRSDLIFRDLERLRQIAREAGPFQILFGGKAHPRDTWGKDIIRHIFQAGESLKDVIPVVYLEEYDMVLAKYLVSGVDVWLNTPHKPLEASGTSGMKAALNGVPSLSILDGWWIEGYIEGVTGWSIGEEWQSESNPEKDSLFLYDKLEHVVLPTFYQRPSNFASMMRSAIAFNGSFFTAQRMLSQYLQNAYLHPANGTRP
ncbi:MAG: alpha-glucan family phosphorylase [Chloroflexi bacterium]|nr:alpha-glucan family phosphorylase [Chloroflexota bacterium]